MNSGFTSQTFGTSGKTGRFSIRKAPGVVVWKACYVGFLPGLATELRRSFSPKRSQSRRRFCSTAPGVSRSPFGFVHKWCTLNSLAVSLFIMTMDLGCLVGTTIFGQTHLIPFVSMCVCVCLVFAHYTPVILIQRFSYNLYYCSVEGKPISLGAKYLEIRINDDK